MTLRIVFVLLTQLSFSAEVPEHQTRMVEGWTVQVSDRLLKESPDDTAKALSLLATQLQEIIRLVPAPAVARLKTVPLWFSPEYKGVQPRAEYHPGEDWLRDHGRNPAMAKGVEFTNIRTFQAEMNRMPNFALHELAHAYHDQVHGYGNVEIKAAYERARDSHSYDKVERRLGIGRPNITDRAYAMTNPQEYFAESSEAFFTNNDFYPFNRADLEKHDPEMAKLLARLWQVTDPLPAVTSPPGNF